MDEIQLSFDGDFILSIIERDRSCNIFFILPGGFIEFVIHYN